MMHKMVRWVVRLAMLSAITATLVHGSLTHAATLSQVTVTQMMNWYPQPELGGQFAADTLGYYKQAGLNERIVPYDPKADSTQLISDGRLSFGVVSADQLLEARAKGLHLVAVMNTFQINPKGLLWHTSEHIHSLADLSGHSIIRTPTTWWTFLMQKYHYTNIIELDNDYSFKQFYANPNAVLECYVTSEPYIAHQAGKDVRWMLIADSGFDPYPGLIATSDSMIRDHPDTVRAFVSASLRGWQTFLDDPTSTFSVLETYPDARDYPLTPNAMQFSYLQLRSLVTGGEATLHGVGTMSARRFAELAPQLSAVGIPLNGLNPSTAYTLQFVPH